MQRLAPETIWGTLPWVLTMQEEPFLTGFVRMWVLVATQVGNYSII